MRKRKGFAGEGTFGDYLNLLKEKPWVAQTAHSRVYNMIKDAGIEEEKVTKGINFLATNYLG